VTGEETQEAGRIGARRAKIWLEATTRAKAPWVNPVGAAKLKFPWANSGTFSYDLGGVFRGDELDGLEFFAESKFYTKAHDQAALYREYLAKCYRAFRLMPQRCDTFLWITWSPFMVKRWDEIRTPEFVYECVDTFRTKAHDPQDGPNVDKDLCEEISKRAWLIFLSAEQEKLVPTSMARRYVEAFVFGDGG
jgi:hypothetical protein